MICNTYNAVLDNSFKKEKANAVKCTVFFISISFERKKYKYSRSSTYEKSQYTMSDAADTLLRQ